jgi:hypothetical protein
MTTTPSSASGRKLSLPNLTLGSVKLRAPSLAFWALAAIIVATMVVVHFAAGFTLPAPWGDEAFFVWQARAFERWNNFAAPELDASRPVLLLPFIYQFILGMAFKILGYSLGLARGLSLAFTIGGFVLLAMSARRRAAPLAGLVLIGAFMMNGHFVAMANNARMEALLFAVICGAMLLMQHGRIWIALAILSFSPMIHPNGVLFLAPALVYAVAVQKVHRTRPSRTALIIFAAAALAWLANGLYAVSYWPGLMHDIAYRFSETSTATSGWSQFGGWHAVTLALIIATGVLGAVRKIRIGYLVTFAIGSWLMHRVRIEQWYEVFGTLSYLLLSLAVLEVATQVLPSLKTRFGSAPRWAVASVALVGLLGLNLASGRVPGPKGYLEDLDVNGMRVAGSVGYFTGEDRAALETYFRASVADGAKTFEMYPWGDTLLIGDFEKSGMRFQIPYFDPAFSAGAKTWAWGFGPTEWPTADVYVVRTSRYQPRWLDERFKATLARAEQRTGKKAEILRSRDETEVWYAIRAGAP